MKTTRLAEHRGLTSTVCPSFNQYHRNRWFKSATIAAMSFDVFLQRFECGEPGVVNADRVRAVLLSREFTGPDRFGFYDVSISDGIHVEFSAKGLADGTGFDGCAFHIRSMSAELVQFVWEIATAGDMVIMPAMEDFVPILSSPEQITSLPSDLRRDYPHPVVCGSAAELESLLNGGYTGWKKYRDQIANGSL
jgi:hypothetical protein